MRRQSARDFAGQVVTGRAKLRRRPASFLPAVQALRTVASDDGSIRFGVRPCTEGLYVERVRIHSASACLAQSMRFPDEASFTRWCESDRLRFTYPLVYSNLQRTGSDLFARVG